MLELQQSYHSNVLSASPQLPFTAIGAGLETTFGALTSDRPATALNVEQTISLNRQKSAISIDLDARSLQANRRGLAGAERAQSATAVVKLLRATAERASQSSPHWDLLTGLDDQQPIAGQNASFNPINGYGMVNAAKAVARSIGRDSSTFTEVPDWGGFYWGVDRVKAQEVWQQGFAGQGITVAVIDSGVDITHPDLNDNIWRNAGEIAGDGVDNDRNGYVDDLYGWNFAVGQNNNNVSPGTTDPGQRHGTHVAGTIAAESNQFGTTGIAPNAKIMALRIGEIKTGADGRGIFTNSGSLAQAIRYAVDNGARVINMSLGWTPTPELVSALEYAASRNVIAVSSAGNSSQATPGTPASFATHLGISVGATDFSNNVASFSNWAGFDSRMQHVVAPGVSIWSTVPGGYARLNGTSMAAPHIAGVVALMLSANPTLTHAQVRYILTQSTTA